ncbi:MAG TPA: hypothetical protein PLY87_27050 [Planctomycetaceae bacterium]|nr:hypothetical protein [Planctomycetaceae bacterium]
MRTILDPAELRPLFGAAFRRLQRGKALEPFVSLDGHNGNDCERNATRRPARANIST